MKRGAYKFLCGLFAGFAIEHAAIAVLVSRVSLDLPIFGVREWGGESGWFGVVLYSAVSLWMGYLGWRSEKVPGGTLSQT